MTALALAPDTGISYGPAAAARADRVIRVSTAVAVLAVAGVAAYVSYWHAYAVICAHGETGITARLEPATIDGLVYASSMVNLYAARHRLPVPALARWLLALSIVATLAANMAQGWSHGPVGAVIAAWPAVSLVGSYELLVWIIRTAAAGDLDRGPGADHSGPRPVHYGTSFRPAAAQQPDTGSAAGLMPRGADGPLPVPGMTAAGTGKRTRLGRDRPRGPGGGPVVRLTGADDCRRPGQGYQRRRGDRLPRQPSARQADLRAQARRDVRQNLPPLGAQPDGRSPAEPGTGLTRHPLQPGSEIPPAASRRDFDLSGRGLRPRDRRAALPCDERVTDAHRHPLCMCAPSRARLGMLAAGVTRHERLRKLRGGSILAVSARYWHARPAGPPCSR